MPSPTRAGRSSTAVKPRGIAALEPPSGPSRPRAERPPLVQLLEVCLVALAIGACGWLSSRFRVVAIDGGDVVLLRPVTGVALGVLLRFGVGLWPGVLAGAALASLHQGFEPWVIAAGAALQTLQIVATALVLERIGDFNHRLDRTRDVALLGLVGGLAFVLPSAILGARLALGPDAGDHLLVLAFQRLLEGAVSIMVVAPVVLVLELGALRRLGTVARLELLAMLAAVAFVSFAAFGRVTLVPQLSHLLTLSVYPFVILVAFRFGKAGGSLVALTASVAAAAGFSTWAQPLSIESSDYGIMNLAAFSLIVAVTALFLSASLLERTGAKQRLADTEATFRSLFEHSPIGIAIERGRELRIVNGALTRMFGYVHPSELVGKREQDLIESGDEVDAARSLPRETLGLRRDGTRFPIQVDEATIPGTEGYDTVRFVADVSARKKLEEQFRHAQKMEAVGQLAGGVAHDFNNLLTVITGYADVLCDPVAHDPLLSDHVRNILAAADRAGTLTRQLLAFSRRQVLQPEIVDLNRRIADFSAVMRRLIGERIELLTDLGADVKPIEVDPAQLDQVLLNLVVNARDAMPHGGRLTVRTAALEVPAGESLSWTDARPGSYAVLEVIDTGHGMDAPTCSRIFEPYFTTKEVGKGTGLGLSTVYGIVQQSEGHIRVKSAPEQGTRFTIVLPAASERSAAARAGTKAGSAPRGSGTVLLVEDETAVRNLIRLLLEGAGYGVLAAESPCLALELARMHPGAIDILLTDVMMPEMTGPELAEQVKALRPAIACLLMSGYSEPELLPLHGTSWHGTLLAKPFTPGALMKRLQELTA